MISTKYNCVFVHIPKTAGQSVEHFFLKHHNLTWKQRAPLLLKYNPDPEKGPKRLAHLTASEYVDCGYIPKDEFKTLYKFSFVRNPWARIVSEYNYRDYHKKMSFKDFLVKGLPEKSNYTDAYRHIIPQYDYLYDEGGNLLVDFVGRFEQLQSDFDLVCKELGFDDSTLEHINSSNKKPKKEKNSLFKIITKKNKKLKNYTGYYDDEAIEIVSNMYSKDISAFNYRFGE